jgi:hypothetical protein
MVKIERREARFRNRESVSWKVRFGKNLVGLDAFAYECSELKGAIAGLAIGVILLIGGAFLFVSGIGQPGIVPVRTSKGVVGGNLPLWIGIVLMGAGLVTLGGILSVEIRNWEGGSEESSND